MIELPLQIPTPDGVSDAFLYHQPEAGPSPGVLHLTDIGGIRDSQRQMAGRLASQGYTVLLPNVFYRTGQPPLFDAPFKPGDEKSMKRLHELSSPLTPDAMQRDAAAYVDFLTSRNEASQHSSGKKRIGVVGYCFTGKMAMYAAAARPEVVAAVASFHGGGLCTADPASPHLLLPQIRARLYFGHATEDRSMNPEAIERFNAALAAWGGRYESEIYEGARHGWTVPDSPAYNQPQADRAFAKLNELLTEFRS